MFQSISFVEFLDSKEGRFSIFWCLHTQFDTWKMQKSKKKLIFDIFVVFFFLEVASRQVASGLVLMNPPHTWTYNIEMHANTSILVESQVKKITDIRKLPVKPEPTKQRKKPATFPSLHYNSFDSLAFVKTKDKQFKAAMLNVPDMPPIPKKWIVLIGLSSKW